MNLKNQLLSILLVSIFSANGQQNPFINSNKIISKNYNFTNFNKISILDLDGVTEIEVGKPFSIQTNIKEKYASILEVTESDKELTIVFKYTKDNNKYIKDPDIKVKITCPSLSRLNKRGNSIVFVSKLNQPEFILSNEGNGSVKLKGLIKRLNLTNDGNGKINAKNLLSDTAFVESSSNGDVLVNAKTLLQGNRNGNGKIIQSGKAILTERKRKE
jgi:Putative auto-transporter adhesin, head GIN domain